MSDTMIEARETDTEAILVLAGEIDLSCVCDLRDVARDTLARRPERLVIDVAGVTFITSSVLGALIRISGSARNQGTAFALRNPTPIVLRLLRLSGLETILPVEP